MLPPSDNSIAVSSSNSNNNNNNNNKEITIVAAQDQTISTNHFKKKNLKEEVESKCRLCKQNEEAIDH